ncbi:MAG: DUF421 domain-containing protein [Clostridia bacterium]|nr:DUF421 domain-containing protein [Clostridia bacterium]
MVVVAIRTVIMYVTLIVAMRLMGKRQLGDLQPTELAVTLMISDIAVVPLQEQSAPLFSGIVPIALLAGLELLMSVIMMKAPKLARVISGNPIVIVSDGKPSWEAMRRLRMTVEDLIDGLRELGYFDIRDIETAIVETNGKLSVYLKRDKQPLTGSDMQLSLEDKPMPCVVMTDGELNQFGMALCGWDEARVNETLRKDRIDAKHVMLMTADASGEYTVIRKEE